MEHFLKDIRLDSPDYEMYRYFDIKESKKEKIDSISKINFFIGKNSSGKSRFLRSIMLSIDFEMWHTQNFDSLVELHSKLAKIQYYYDGYEIEALLNIQNGYSCYDPERDHDSAQYILSCDLLKLYKNVRNDVKHIKDLARIKRVSIQSYKQARNALNTLKELLREFSAMYRFDATYIPTIRNAKPMKKIQNTWQHTNDIKNRILDEYFEVRKNTFENKVITGQEIYMLLKNGIFEWNNSYDNRVIEEYENLISEVFFDNEKILIIPKEKENTIHIKIGDKQETALHNMGDGIQSIIIMTYELFRNKEKPYIYFIEEPEIFLHPGFQRKFFEFINLSIFDKHQFFITTHSNNFLDLTFDYNDISIYTFEYIKNEMFFKIRNVSNESVQPMELLGVRNSSLLLSNCTIWVEGITDRYYIKKYLEIFQLQKFGKVMYKEGIHYSFIEYSGNNITHWSFLDGDDQMNYEYITKNIFLIVDNDDAYGAKKIRHEQLNTHLGSSNFYKLNVLEIENLVIPAVLSRVLAKLENNKQKEIQIPSVNTYAMSKLGKFIDNNVKGIEKNYSSQSGSVKNKLKFAKTVLGELKGIDDLHEDAVNLCERILDFIKVNNS